MGDSPADGERVTERVDGRVRVTRTWELDAVFETTESKNGDRLRLMRNGNVGGYDLDDMALHVARTIRAANRDPAHDGQQIDGKNDAAR